MCRQDMEWYGEMKQHMWILFAGEPAFQHLRPYARVQASSLELAEMLLSAEIIDAPYYIRNSKFRSSWDITECKFKPVGDLTLLEVLQAGQCPWYDADKILLKAQEAVRVEPQ